LQHCQRHQRCDYGVSDRSGHHRGEKPPRTARICRGRQGPGKDVTPPSGRSRAPCLPSGCLTTMPPAVCRFPDSPRRTGQAPFSASGSPGSSIPRRGLLPGSSPGRRSPVSPQLSGASWLVASQGVALLASFALWPAFPTSDYYDASDADRASAADCWPVPGQPPTFAPMDSAR
jgi:hypothetical protein